MPGLIRCAAERFGVDVDTALRVGRCESGDLLWPWAHSNGNYGTFQHRGTYWPDRVHSYLHRDWFNAVQWARLPGVPRGAYIARGNVLVTMLMVRRGGWSPWSCY